MEPASFDSAGIYAVLPRRCRGDQAPEGNTRGGASLRGKSRRGRWPLPSRRDERRFARRVQRIARSEEGAADGGRCSYPARTRGGIEGLRSQAFFALAQAVAVFVASAGM